MISQNSQNSHPIIWTIDPYETKNAHRAPLAKFLKILSHDLSQKIMPFSVISPTGMAWPVRVTYEMGKDLKAYGERTVKQDLKKLHMKRLLPARVEVHESSSRRELVNDVLRYAKANNADFIAVNTRQSQSRFPFKLGGFAEALVEKSNLPILAVSPKAKFSNHLKKIVFPTDLTPKSYKAFRKTVKLAKRYGADISLIYVKFNGDTPYFDSLLGISGTYFLDAELSRLEENKAIGKRWCLSANRAGVDCKFEIVRSQESIAQAITKFAKSIKCDLIVLASYRSAHTPAMIGGTVREVLGSAETPILEIRAS